MVINYIYHTSQIFPVFLLTIYLISSIFFSFLKSPNIIFIPYLIIKNNPTNKIINPCIDDITNILVRSITISDINVIPITIINPEILLKPGISLKITTFLVNIRVVNIDNIGI